MSGIAGFTNANLLQDAQMQTIRIMTSKLKHRCTGGYGGQDVWLDEQVALGCSYSGCEQPLCRKVGDREYVIVSDGAICNAGELQAELEKLGHKFHTADLKSAADAEVLLVSYIQWGENCLERLRGMFAFAIWDSDARRLFVARDRFGIKPVFFTEHENQLIFASEIKGILTFPGIEAVIDSDGIAEIFALAPTRTPGFGVFKDIRELEPAHFLVYQDGAVKTQRYWELVSGEHKDDLGTTAEKLRFHVKDSVIRQMNTGSRMATLLSGGLDSSVVTAIVARQFESEECGKLSTYSFDYKDNDKFFAPSSFQPDSDKKWAMKVSKMLGTEHRFLYADTRDLTGLLYEAVKARDLPGMADIDSSLLYFCRQIKQGHDVVLSGEGADEILGGYPWFHGTNEEVGFPWMRNMDERLALMSPEIAAYSDAENYVNRRYTEALEKTPRLVGEDPCEARRREIFYLNLTWFAANLLERKDRMSMASGLEARVPFVDHKLIEYVWNIPWAMKALGGREKGILRLAMKGILSEDVIERKKSPFPKTHNPDYERVVKTELANVLNDSGSKITSLIDREVIQTYMKEESAIGKPFFGQLMSRPQLYAFLLQVDFWLKHYEISVR